MVEKVLTAEDIWTALDEIHDPEIPVVSLVELGIVRDVQVFDQRVSVTLTPTFAGCPAFELMKALVREKLIVLGFDHVEIKLNLTPPWTSDWMTDTARAKIEKIGLAPPPRHGGNVLLFFPENVACPYCGSSKTRIKNSFGPTLCRAIWFCTNCHQPFEQFKPL